MTTADLLVLALRVLPGKIRERLNAEYGFVVTGPVCHLTVTGSGKATWSPGSTASFTACGEKTRGEILERR